jgi:hypothetical protein
MRSAAPSRVVPCEFLVVETLLQSRKKAAEVASSSMDRVGVVIMTPLLRRV